MSRRFSQMNTDQDRKEKGKQPISMFFLICVYLRASAAKSFLITYD